MQMHTGETRHSEFGGRHSCTATKSGRAADWRLPNADGRLPIAVIEGIVRGSLK